jgi:hypothetical protein
MGVAALGAAQHLDTHDSAGAGVVGDLQHRLHLDHCCFSNLTRGARRRHVTAAATVAANIGRGQFWTPYGEDPAAKTLDADFRAAAGKRKL